MGAADVLCDMHCDVRIARGGLKCISEQLSDRRWAVICDETVAKLYGQTVLKGLHNAELFSVPVGESSKSIKTYEELCFRLANEGFTRDDGIIALGGGVIGDLAGFIAATFQRGVALVQVPTTLLSQTDSCIGGKVGIDLVAKNQLGTFYRPELVIIDPDTLNTLPQRQLSCGVAEIIKYGLIADETILDMLEQMVEDWDTIICKCLKTKARLVAADEYDHGERRVLNFGHTLGHGYEILCELNHGEAVAAGMAEMLRYQLRRGDKVQDIYDRLLLLLERYRLPREVSCDKVALRSLLERDKKMGTVVTLTAVGQPRLERISPEELVK